MNIHDYRFLLSEQFALNRMIEGTPETDVIDRMSLEARLEEVEIQLKDYEGYSSHLVDGSLTFEGNPVVGSRGIDAEFGSKAVSAFSKAVNLVGASSHGPLKSKGRVPQKENYRLLITGTALGSYGFKVEAASQKPVPVGEVPSVESAVTQVKKILEASVKTDEELADTIGEIDNRALNGVHDFLKTVAENGAVCTLTFKGDMFRFRDSEQVRHSQKRLSRDHIREESVVLTGTVLGFFPHIPRIQLELTSPESAFWGSEVDKIIEAKVDPTIAPAFDSLLHRDVTVDAQTRRVGLSRPTYNITGLREYR